MRINVKKYLEGSKVASRDSHALSIVQVIKDNLLEDEFILDFLGVEIIVSHFMSDTFCSLITEDSSYYDKIKFDNLPNNFTKDKIELHRELARKLIKI